MNASIREVFPPDKPVARFVVSVAAARNEIESALVRAVQANESDDPEFHAHVRTSVGWLFEGVKALRAYRDEFDEVRSLLATLSPDGQKNLKLAANVGQQVGAGVLDHARDRTFHFPHPDAKRATDFDSELQDVLESLADEDATVVALGDRRVRLQFADRVMLAWTLGKHSTEADEMRQQFERTQQAAVAFAVFVDELTARYLDGTGAKFGTALPKP